MTSDEKLVMEDAATVIRSAYGARQNQDNLSCHVGLCSAAECANCTRTRFAWDTAERLEALTRL